MNEPAKKVLVLIDPFEELLDEMEGGHLDGHLIHLCSWSDVVKNDLRKALKRDDQYINHTLHALLKGARDSQGRYVYRPTKQEALNEDTYSANYVKVQCLLSEWISVYRSAAVYIDSHREFEGSDSMDDFDFAVD